MSTALIADLRQLIITAAGMQKPHPERRFHKDDEYLTFGLATPDFRGIMREFRPRFFRLPLRERLELAVELLGEHIGELGHAGIEIIALNVKELTTLHFPLLDLFADHLRDWSEVDHFCADVVQPLLCKHAEDMLALLYKWNRSPNRWKRRASVVAFTRKLGESGKFTKHVLKLCENLIWDEHDIVRKGVGWALKDNLRSAPNQVLALIKRARSRGVSSTITLYAIRDLKGAARQEVLAVKVPRGMRK